MTTRNPTQKESRPAYKVGDKVTWNAEKYALLQYLSRDTVAIELCDSPTQIVETVNVCHLQKWGGA